MTDPIPGEMRPVLLSIGASHGAWCWDEHFTPWFRARGFQAVDLDLRGHGSAGGPAAGMVLAAPIPHNLVGFAARLAKANPVGLLSILATLSFQPLIGTPDAFSIFFSRATPRVEIARLQAKAQDESFRAWATT
jgi:hypothetical protein